jgi:predicted transcriptional regulator
MTKQTTVRLSDDLAAQAEIVARTKGVSVNQLITSALEEEIKRVSADKEFTNRVQALVARDKAILDRLAQ